MLDPRIPDDWPGYEIDFRTPSGRTLYQISVLVRNGAGEITGLEVDGEATTLTNGTARWPMVDDGATHTVRVALGGGRRSAT